jgi:hypothetical protein
VKKKMAYKIKFRKSGGFATFGSGGSSYPSSKVINKRAGGTIIFKNRTDAINYKK